MKQYNISRIIERLQKTIKGIFNEKLVITVKEIDTDIEIHVDKYHCGILLDAIAGSIWTFTIKHNPVSEEGNEPEDYELELMDGMATEYTAIYLLIQMICNRKTKEFMGDNVSSI